jgi:hypothetical protein
MSTKTTGKEKKPDYVLALEKAYGPPSQEGFGSAVFFEKVEEDSEMEEAARKYYEHFVGDRWAEWGEETWMSAWKEVYARKSGAKHDIVKELQGIDDFNASMSVPMILDVVENTDEAKEALSGAYDGPEVADLGIYTIGDGEAMSGLLIAGRREKGEATLLVFLMD